jgi:hypothetical protein
VKRYIMILTLALVLGGCAPSIWGEGGPCNFCVTGPPPSTPLETVLDGSVYRDGSICGTPLAPYHVTCRPGSSSRRPSRN